MDNVIKGTQYNNIQLWESSCVDVRKRHIASKAHMVFINLFSTRDGYFLLNRKIFEKQKLWNFLLRQLNLAWYILLLSDKFLQEQRRELQNWTWIRREAVSVAATSISIAVTLNVRIVNYFLGKQAKAIPWWVRGKRDFKEKKGNRWLWNAK